MNFQQNYNLIGILRKKLNQKSLFLIIDLKMKSLLKSFCFAFQGILHLLKKERNFKIQFGIFILLVIFALFFKISKYEWLCVFICSMSVLSLEGINTSIERLCNEIEPNLSPKIKIIKDAAAGAVLITSIFSVIIGFIIFFPYVYRLAASL
jgi:diacylglycerol kinase